MPCQVAPANPSRVLALFPSPRTTGQVAFDGFGLVARSFTTLELRRVRGEPRRALAAFVSRSVRVFRPAMVAIATHESSAPDLVAAVERAARGAALRPTIISVEESMDALVGVSPPPGYDKLAQVVAAFLPELADRVRPESAKWAPRWISTRRSRSAQWKAAAAGVALLIHERPAVAFALLRGRLPPGSPIPALLARSFTRLHPV